MRECDTGDSNRVPSRLTVEQHAKLLQARAKVYGVNMTDEQARRAGEILLRKERLIGRPGLRGLHKDKTKDKTKDITKGKTIEKKIDKG